MNEKVLNTLEYEKIKAQLMPLASTAAGSFKIAELQPASDYDTVVRWLDETADGVHVLRLKGSFPIPKLADITPHLKRLRIGANLNGVELAQIMKTLQAASQISDFMGQLAENEVDLNVLYELEKQLIVLPDITQQLNRSVDDEGNIRDSASSQLTQIRQKIARLSDQIRSKMNQYVHGSQAKYLSEPIVTIRDDRYVLPVKAEYRGHFGGVVHDQSATGQTLYMEPQNMVDLNNQLHELQLSEQQEIQRILAELSAELEPYEDQLGENQDVVGQFDYINAKARLAKLMKATEPEVNQDHIVDLIQARHPLIPQEKVVPNDIKLGGEYDAIVITGPNTGGKTITLKTLGLTQLMAQSGLFIPADEHSQVGVYEQIFADIGDEQSIEENLSTFSSHMDNIIKILEDLTKDDLVLFDEIGGGTDPKEGAALAIAILNYIGEIGAQVVATTHYPELKAYGYDTPKTLNASMEFDAKTLQPTYHFLMGVPGRSNAFQIATQLGLSQAIVDQATQMIDTDTQDLNEMITSLEAQRQAAQKEADDLKGELDQATELHQELQTAFESFKQKEDKELQKARERANEIVKKAKSDAKEIIDELHSMQSRSVKENEIIDEKTKLNQLQKATEPVVKNRVLRREKEKQALHPGDSVKVLSYGQTGELIKPADNNHWMVQLGILKMKVANDDIEKIEPPKSVQPKRHMVSINRNDTVKSTLDLRGERYEEAMGDLDRFIDAALLAGYQKVTIVHGIGTGAIRQGVQKFLAKNRHVKDYHYAAANAGGTGATEVELQ